MDLRETTSVICSNIPDGTSRSDLTRLFSKYGEIECLQIHDSKAFVCFGDERAARYAVRDLTNTELGRDGRKLIAGLRYGCRRRHDRTPSKKSPSKTLYVFNFDTQVGLRRYFELYGEVRQLIIRGDAALVRFASQEDATRALEGAHMSKVGDKVLKVDYCNKRSPSPVSPPGRRGRRSPSPVSRPLRGSPSYNRYDGPRTDSPVYRGRRSSDRA